MQRGERGAWSLELGDPRWEEAWNLQEGNQNRYETERNRYDFRFFAFLRETRRGFGGYEWQVVRCQVRTEN
jgi:hypothetical protein